MHLFILSYWCYFYVIKITTHFLIFLYRCEKKTRKECDSFSRIPQRLPHGTDDRFVQCEWRTGDQRQHWFCLSIGKSSLRKDDVAPLRESIILKFCHSQSFSDLLTGPLHLFTVFSLNHSTENFWQPFRFPYLWADDFTSDSCREGINVKTLRHLHNCAQGKGEWDFFSIPLYSVSLVSVTRYCNRIMLNNTLTLPCKKWKLVPFNIL